MDYLLLSKYLDFENEAHQSIINLIELDLIDYYIDEDSGQLMLCLTKMGQDVAKEIGRDLI